MAALFSTFTVLLISTPFSNRVAASVRSPCFIDVIRTVLLSKHALSKNICWVLWLIPLSAPPYTPAMHILAWLLAIIKSVATSFRSTASSVIKACPSVAFFTIMVLFTIFEASKACNGCPVSCNIKLVISTMLFMHFTPIAFSLFCSHIGLSPTVMPLMLTPAYLLQASVFSICTLIGSSLLSGLKLFLKGNRAPISVLSWCHK